MTCGDLKPDMVVELWDPFHKGHFSATVVWAVKYIAHPRSRVEVRFKWARNKRLTTREKWADDPVKSIMKEPVTA